MQVLMEKKLNFIFFFHFPIFGYCRAAAGPTGGDSSTFVKTLRVGSRMLANLNPSFCMDFGDFANFPDLNTRNCFLCLGLGCRIQSRACQRIHQPPCWGTLQGGKTFLQSSQLKWNLVFPADSIQWRRTASSLPNSVSPKARVPKTATHDTGP